MRVIKESYGRIGDNENRFDIEFWQWQGDQAIFQRSARYDIGLLDDQARTC